MSGRFRKAFEWLGIVTPPGERERASRAEVVWFAVAFAAFFTTTSLLELSFVESLGAAAAFGVALPLGRLVLERWAERRSR